MVGGGLVFWYNSGNIFSLNSLFNENTDKKKSAITTSDRYDGLFIFPFSIFSIHISQNGHPLKPLFHRFGYHHNRSSFSISTPWFSKPIRLPKKTDRIPCLAV